jgi:periplasmic protein TonB
MGAGAVMLVVIAGVIAAPQAMRWLGLQTPVPAVVERQPVQPATATPVAEKVNLPAAPVNEPAPPPRAAAAGPAAPQDPTGRFFELTDVDESPAITRRIEPRIPRNVPARALNDVVVVRVLVSQTGHPFRVSLLRRSKHGPPVDDAVVAAVSQWMFSPARKRGEAVSCWYNIAVPLGQAD